jgi:hypothetical protein
MKKCKKCQNEKELKDFYDGRNSCKECSKRSFKENYNKNRSKKLEYQKKYYEENIDLIFEYRKNYLKENSDKINQKKREKYELSPDKIKESSKKYYHKNKDEINRKRKGSKVSLQYYHENKEDLLEKTYKFRKEKMSSDPFYKLKHQIRNLIRGAFKRKFTSKSKKTIEILGCSFEEFKLCLESKFDENMNWENYGSYWHIDHIKPISLAKDEREVYDLNHYSNFQPLFWLDNLTKSDKWEGD